MKAKDTSKAAFKMAKINRWVEQDKELIFHSDRGIQYACKEFTNELNQHKNIVRSMSRKEIVGIMQLRKASLAASSRNAANGGITKPAMKHSRTFCSISLYFITAKDCIHTWITKAQTNMKQKQQNR